LAAPIVVDARPEAHRAKAQLKTRIPAKLRRDIALVALERKRPLTVEVEEALRAHIARARLQAAADYVA